MKHEAEFPEDAMALGVLEGHYVEELCRPTGAGWVRVCLLCPSVTASQR